jgi:hypothetical protein
MMNPTKSSNLAPFLLAVVLAAVAAAIVIGLMPPKF